LSGNNNLPVRLNGNRFRPVCEAEKIRRDLPVSVETCVETAVAVVTGEGKILIISPTGKIAIPGCYNFAVRLQSDGAGEFQITEVSCNLAARAESRIQHSRRRRFAPQWYCQEKQNSDSYDSSEKAQYTDSDLFFLMIMLNLIFAFH